ncbi:hypothetical protein CANARDRAFT_176619 [[Candida] arabinofermentans NRRL YB-2248]|uniref:Major facilitator superfamily (MFS) profile domain-containing protein n=1 Tax=[Candida] arabinofermentans NRRL YB-2248 TaxID=983967 RepID=A0A1E4SZ84_9ASCO|nr:hypothetical protein CANARDRAFT_176619 [[Candida] arabinofermentans NRRL YB-2248]
MSDNSINKEKDQHNELNAVISITKEQIGTTEVITTFISPGGREVKVTGDVDEAMALALEAEVVEVDEETNARILRKTDLYLMPVFCFLYAVQFMDKTTNSYAAIMGLKTDLHMVGNQYSWVGSAFYLGYLFFELPASYCLQRFPLAKATAAFIVIWAITLMLHATPNYAGFIFLRVALGGFESAVTPAMVILTSQWYKKEEQFFRTAIWFSFNGFGIIFGSSIAYGISIHSENWSIEGWKVLFIITGLLTMVVGIVFLVHVPDNPSKAWFLTQEEKILVLNRIRTNNQGFGNKHFKMYQLKETLTDYRTWLYFTFAFLTNIPNGGLTNFGSILLSQDFNYGKLDALLMGMPSGAVELVGCILFGFSVKFIKHRLAIALFSIVISLMASCLLAFCDYDKKAKLTGYYLSSLAPVGMICCLSCFSSNVAGHTKKVTTNAIYLIGYCTGNIVGPQTFKENQAPHYSSAKIAMVACYSIALVNLSMIYFSYWRDNRIRDKLEAERIANGGPAFFMENQEFADLTDFENPNFRYAL